MNNEFKGYYNFMFGILKNIREPIAFYLSIGLVILGAQSLEAIGVYVGTYTSSSYGNGKGIYYFSLDNGVINSQSILANYAIGPNINPSYLLTLDDKHLYAVNEFSQINGPIASSGITSYAITNNSLLTTLNTELTGLAAPVYLLTDNSQRTLIVANYGDGSINSTSGISVIPIQSNHQLAPYSQRIVFPSTPTVSHIHGLAKVTQEGIEYIFATDLGTNTLYAYTFSKDKPDPLQPFATARGSTGQGPRHVIPSLDGKYLYVANEFDASHPVTSSLSIYSFNPHESPYLTYLTSVPAEQIEDGNATKNLPAEIAISGQHIYVSNRGGDNIAQFSLIKDGADLSFVEQFPLRNASKPRQFAITPDGNFMVVACQSSNNVIIFKIEENGALTQTSMISINTPVAVAFIADSPSISKTSSLNKKIDYLAIQESLLSKIGFSSKNKSIKTWLHNTHTNQIECISTLLPFVD